MGWWAAKRTPSRSASSCPHLKPTHHHHHHLARKVWARAVCQDHGSLRFSRTAAKKGKRKEKTVGRRLKRRSADPGPLLFRPILLLCRTQMGTHKNARKTGYQMMCCELIQHLHPEARRPARGGVAGAAGHQTPGAMQQRQDLALASGEKGGTNRSAAVQGSLRRGRRRAAFWNMQHAHGQALESW